MISGTLASALHHGLTLSKGAAIGIKGGWLATTYTYPSEMAQNFWTAIYAWTTCFVATIVISLATRQRKSDEELRGLVYALTPRLKDRDLPLLRQPATLGLGVLARTLALNILFW